jgi:hypothetical protein
MSGSINLLEYYTDPGLMTDPGEYAELFNPGTV